MRKPTLSFAGLALLLALVAAPAIVKAEYWVLKNPATGITTNASDYEISTAMPCSESTVFCGFTAPPGANPNEPDLSDPDLFNDLDRLSDDPGTYVNDSGDIHYQD